MKPGSPKPPALPLGDRLAQRRTRIPRRTMVDRGVFDALKRRRETEDDPPDLQDSYSHVAQLLELDEPAALREAAIDLVAAAMAIVCRIPPETGLT